MSYKFVQLSSVTSGRCSTARSWLACCSFAPGGLSPREVMVGFWGIFACDSSASPARWKELFISYWTIFQMKILPLSETMDQFCYQRRTERIAQSTRQNYFSKIEKAVHDWIEYRRDLLDNQSQLDGATGIGYDTCPASPGSKDCTLRSPTLRQLLEHEVDLDTHDNSRLPRLKDKTAAMGLLWVRRQLQYQTALFANILHVRDLRTEGYNFFVRLVSRFFLLSFLAIVVATRPSVAHFKASECI